VYFETTVLVRLKKMNGETYIVCKQGHALRVLCCILWRARQYICVIALGVGNTASIIIAKTFFYDRALLETFLNIDLPLAKLHTVLRTYESTGVASKIFPFPPATLETSCLISLHFLLTDQCIIQNINKLVFSITTLKFKI
jgi:hypothetical protein